MASTVHSTGRAGPFVLTYIAVRSPDSESLELKICAIALHSSLTAMNGVFSRRIDKTCKFFLFFWGANSILYSPYLRGNDESRNKVKGLITASFESFNTFREGWSVCFNSPQAVFVADRHDQVLPILQFVEKAAQNGFWAAFMLTYEAAAAFDPILRTHQAAGDFPLAWAAIFDSPCSSPVSSIPGSYWVSGWEPQITQSAYTNAIQKIRDYIARGETYQTNYTFPLQCQFNGDPLGWYRNLCAAQSAGYCAYLDLGRYQILSISPELFFERRGTSLILRPMKGTMSRGRWKEEDENKATELSTCEKNRAENLMIVDLIRSDLGKISTLGTVQVTRLFEVERYESLWQMTSLIESTVRPGTSLTDIFRALYPSGSITGAPKVRTMEIIHELEPFPRLVYTGAIGFIRPDGNCIFNVAIRTIVLDTKSGIATFGVGSGITYDSAARNEYEECVLKTQFLNNRRHPFQLLESILLDSGEFFLLDRHIDRLKSSARYFGYALNEASLRSKLDRLCETHAVGSWKVRLLIAKNGQITIEPHEITTAPDKIYRVTLAMNPIASQDPFIFHKTTSRAFYEHELRSRPDCNDIIFWNERNEITESSTANLVLVENGRRWTPLRSSGLLAGTYRDELLSKGEIQERIIYKDELRKANSFFLINSVRTWIPAVLVD